jgi:hypothetical protein
MPQLADVEVSFVSLVDKAAVRDPDNPTQPRRFCFYKREGSTEGSSMEDNELRDALTKAEREKTEAEEAKKAAEESLAEVTAERDTALRKLKARPTKDGDDDDESHDEGGDVSKAELPPELRKRLEKIESDAETRIAKAEKRAEGAEAIAKGELDRRVEAEYIAKAQTLEHLPVQAQSFGPLLKRASESLSAEDMGALQAVLKAADEQIAKGDLFREVGAGVGGQALPDGADAEILAKAEALRKADPKMTQAEAEVAAIQGDPALQARYLAEGN